MQQVEEGQMGEAKRPEEIDERAVRGPVMIAFDQQLPALGRIKEIGTPKSMGVRGAQALHQACGIAALPGSQRLVKLPKALPQRR